MTDGVYAMKYVHNGGKEQYYSNLVDIAVNCVHEAPQLFEKCTFARKAH